MHTFLLLSVFCLLRVGAEWTWMAGSSLGNQQQIGTLGVASPSNTPAATLSTAFWLEKKQQEDNSTKETLRIFGGYPRTNSASWSFYTDTLLWNWTADNSATAVYGTQVFFFSVVINSFLVPFVEMKQREASADNFANRECLHLQTTLDTETVQDSVSAIRLSSCLEEQDIQVCLSVASSSLFLFFFIEGLVNRL